MSSAKPAPAAAKTAAEICRNFPLSEAAGKLLRPDMPPRPFLDLLIDKQHFADASRFLAHSMPKREAVWWACLCTRPERGATLPPPMVAALQAAEAWVADPTDEKRRAAFAAAQAAGSGNPVGLLGVAIFFSGGSLAPAEYQAVPPPEHLTASMAANAVILVAVAEPPKMAAKYRQLLALGTDVTAGKNRWKEGPAPAAKPGR
jgi:hypothetical protein